MVDFSYASKQLSQSTFGMLVLTNNQTHSNHIIILCIKICQSSIMGLAHKQARNHYGVLTLLENKDINN